MARRKPDHASAAVSSAVSPAAPRPANPLVHWWRTSGTLAKAFAVSLLVHALVLAVRFTAPQAFTLKQADAGLDVVLVNAKSAQRPRQPTVLAQANLDGGGAHDDARATTPLPAQPEPRDGDPVREVQRRIAQLEQEQMRLLTQARERDATMRAAPPRGEEDSPASDARGRDARDSLDEMSRLEAEIGRKLQHYAKRPKRHQLTATSAQEAVYARYYDGLRRRIEARGTANFPRRGGKPLYGQLIVVINVNRDGGLGWRRDGYQAGAVEVVKSSGDPALDRQAVAIVRAAAPFGAFSPEMRARYDILEIVSTFTFSRAGFETRLQAR